MLQMTMDANAFVSNLKMGIMSYWLPYYKVFVAYHFGRDG